MRHSCFRIGVVAVLAAVVVATGVASPAATGRPNIIFILADDLGLPGVSCYGGEYPTPNLDALAARGIRFENCFASPLCAPSRAMAMTGRYGFRTGVVDNPLGARATPKREVSIAKVLQGAGYVTGVFGKWRQLAHFKTRADAQAWGFDEFLLWGSGSGEGSDRYWGGGYNLNGAPLKVPPQTYGPDLLQEHLVDFIRRHRDRRFFVYYPMTLVHGTYQPTPATRPGVKDRRTLYRDMIRYMDKLVGDLVGELDALGLREKTLIVFTGDNGSVDPGLVHGRPVDGVKHELR
ncbi:MAG: sulfatase-like hydrolase/transferase, partial [Verrucomicrobiales bacterium]|nr:sulfatase-like hydrolase/transferase [Verrucomicrobiales bacterium]